MKQVLLIVLLIGGLSGVLATRARSEAAATTAASASESYAKHCASCHGKDGRARTFKAKLNHARNLTDPEWQDRVSDERIFNSVMNGKGKMPEYSKKLSEQEINALVSYVRSLRK
jgi:mono/diheme cytochrome c family protein